jgi:hypothetical protein
MEDVAPKPGSPDIQELRRVSKNSLGLRREEHSKTREQQTQGPEVSDRAQSAHPLGNCGGRWWQKE